MAELNEIKATSKNGRELTILYDFGGSLEKAVELFGEEVVYKNFTKSAVITAQNTMRRYLEQDKPAEEIESKMAGWKPGVPLERVVDPIAATIAKFAKMSPEEKAALLAKLADL